MISISDFRNVLSSTHALTTHGLSERAALSFTGSLPRTEEGEAVARALIDLGWIIQHVAEQFNFDQVEALALARLIANTAASEPEDGAELLLSLHQLDKDASENESVDAETLARLSKKTSRLPTIHRLVLYRLLVHALWLESEQRTPLEDALKIVGVIK